MPPSLSGQLFNYPGLLIVPGTRHSGAEAGPAPVNDWLFHRGPLGAGRRRRDIRSLRAPGLCCCAVASAFFTSPDLQNRLKIAFFFSSWLSQKSLRTWGGLYNQHFWMSLDKSSILPDCGNDASVSSHKLKLFDLKRNPLPLIGFHLATWER